MIYDVHSHAWRYPDHFNDTFRAQAFRMRGYELDLTPSYEGYLSSAQTADAPVKTVVFGGKARLSGLWTPDRYVVEYCAAYPDQTIPFMSLDPTQDGWREEMTEGREHLDMRGIKLLPMYAGFYPQDPELDDLWRYASRNGLPVLLHTGTTFVDQAPLDCTLPRHLDAVAIKYPDCRIIMAHLGHPYEGETVAVIRKHPNVYADISGLHYRPFQLYHSLMLVQEYGVWNKLLFGTDYPVTTVDDTLRDLRGLNAMLEGTSLPRLDEEEMEGMIHRDAGEILGKG
ncbi:MAG: amidohydrolase [Gemmatimonadetes bacterium]|nr:amidohydrolase [Gemmatimonadota bacterium]MYG86241.1 amidohydrolase [Gemmatimonadota bacterium]MYJ90259.1 amidohydrolase [Gemmatimonadota bacterium]